jgi:peptidyl-prolyl cis-trans isomerase B (cyclophilin B)
MATKRQARAAQRRRHEQFEHKVVVRLARKRRRQQIGAATAAGALLLGGGGVIAAGIINTPTSTPIPTPVTSPSPSISPSLGFPSDLAGGREWTGTIALDQGTLDVSLDGAAAPLAASSFIYLAQQGFFTGIECHRLTTEGAYVLQCGDPTGTGSGGPPYRFGPVENAPLNNNYPAGTIAMARVAGDGYSMGSQFFIVYRDSTIPSDSAGGYTVFGMVTGGLDTVEGIAAVGTDTGGPDGRPANPVVIREVSVS